MTVERWEEETDEDWAERLAQEMEIANNTETTKYFFKSGYEEDEIILHYVGVDSWTWKEHPEGPFKASQIIEWKTKAETFDRLFPDLKYLAQHADKVVAILQSSTQTAIKEVKE